MSVRTSNDQGPGKGKAKGNRGAASLSQASDKAKIALDRTRDAAGQQTKQLS
jgi:hypothetical protein